MSNFKLFQLTGTSPAAASTAVLATCMGMGHFERIKIEASLLGATGGTLDVYLQWTPNGSDWFDYAHFAQLASGASAIKYSCDSAFGAVTTPTVIGSGTSPALAVATCLGGGFGIGMRAICVAGVSTSAGAVNTINLWASTTSV